MNQPEQDQQALLQVNRMKKKVLLFICCILFLPNVAESIYTPFLPDLSNTFAVSNQQAEVTITIYIMGMALGMLVWGNVSDVIGRTKAAVLSLCCFVIGCWGCYHATSISIFYLSRFVQAIGGGGTILAQSIQRDVFSVEERVRVSSLIGAVVYIAPGIGPTLGVWVAAYFSWQVTFLVMGVLGVFLMSLIAIGMPETHKHYSRGLPDHQYVLNQIGIMQRDRKLWGFSLIHGMTYGIWFSLLSEGPFYMIEMMGLTKAGFAMFSGSQLFAYSIGAMITNRFSQYGWKPLQLLLMGQCMMVIIYFCTIIVSISFSVGSSEIVFTIWALLSIATSSSALIYNSCYSSALEDYGHLSGMASSWYGLCYMVTAAIVNLGMVYLHQPVARIMPTYFFVIMVLSLYAYYYGIATKRLKVTISLVDYRQET